MPDSFVSGPREAEAEAEAYGRAYRAHGDQLGQLEAEAAEAHHHRAGLTWWVRALIGPWGDDA